MPPEPPPFVLPEQRNLQVSGQAPFPPSTEAKPEVKGKRVGGRGPAAQLQHSRGFFGVCAATLHCTSRQAKNGQMTNLEMNLRAVHLLLYQRSSYEQGFAKAPFPYKRG